MYIILLLPRSFLSITSFLWYIFFVLFLFSFLTPPTFLLHCRTSEDEDFPSEPSVRTFPLAAGFPLREKVMDFLPLDDCGSVPRIDFRHIQNDLWIGLNAPCDAIPAEASAKPHRPSVLNATGPTGMLFEMEWALDADWFDPDAGWRPYLPKPTSESQEWFFHLEHGTAVDLGTVAQSGECSIHLSTIAEMEADLHRFESYVNAITHSSHFPARGCRPGHYNFDSLRETFDSNQALEDFGANVK